MKSFLQNKFYILIALFAGTIYMSNDAFLPAMDNIALDMKVSKGSIQLAVTTFVTGSLMLQLFMGPLSDKYGRKKTIIICGLVFLVSNFYCGYTNDLTGLLIARIFSGSSMAVIGASGYSAISEFYEESHAIKALSYTANISILAPLLGPIIGAYILKFTGNWRNIFYYDNIMMLVILLLIIVYMPETNKDVIAHKLFKNPKLYDKLSIEEQAELQHHNHQGTSLMEKFRGMILLSKNKTFMAYSLCIGLANFSFMIWITGSPVLLKNVGQTPEQYSLWQIPVFVFMIIGNNVAIYLSKKIGIKKTVDRTMLIMPLASILFIAGTYYFSSSPLGLVIPMASFLLLRGLQNAPINQFILSMSHSFKGSAGSLSGLVAGLGGVLGSFAASRMADSSNLHTVFIMSIGIAVILIVGLIAKYWYMKNQERLGV